MGEIQNTVVLFLNKNIIKTGAFIDVTSLLYN